MNWLSQILGGPDISAQDRYIDDWLKGMEVGITTATGIRVTPDIALQSPGIAANVQVQSEDLAKVPLDLKKRTDNGFEPAVDHPLYALLKYGPSPWLSPYRWRKAMQHGAMAQGNSYSRVWRTEIGQMDRISPIQQGRCGVRWASDGEPFFDVSSSTGIERGLTWQDVIHIAYRDSNDGAENGGVIGVSPIMQNKETVALMIAAEKFAAMFFANGAQPSMILEYDKQLPNDDVAKRIRAGIERVYGGIDNKWKVAILELGMKMREISFDPAKTQLTETRKLGAEIACMMYRTPPHKIGILDKATFSNIEQQSIDYVTGPISAQARSVESAITIACLTPAERAIYKVEHNLEGLMRGDILSRYRAYAIGRQWGWLSVNKVLERENENSIGPEGDEYLVPLNMVPAGEDPTKDDPAKRDGADASSDWQPSDVRYAVPRFSSFNPNKLNGHKPPRRMATLVGARGEPLYLN
ncbi:phage portal protein [Bradyrhizobium yuanmingense]|uniref:phage portal protein n=1 Tax=Bradyrhizobium yuanmingense TaxID=108015 RepID=UPI0004B7E825|nr:phage portal protein [Bradyrhizobium yuanmingense]